MILPDYVQGTFTPLDRALAGHTQDKASDALQVGVSFLALPRDARQFAALAPKMSVQFF